MHVYVCVFACMHVCALYTCLVPVYSLGLELQMFMRHHIGAGNGN